MNEWSSLNAQWRQLQPPDAMQEWPRLGASWLPRSPTKPIEFLVLRNKAAATAWDRDGYTLENDALCLHVIITEDEITLLHPDAAALADVLRNEARNWNDPFEHLAILNNTPQTTTPSVKDVQ